MTETALSGQGQIEIHLSAAEYPADPGSTTTIPVLLHNKGTEEDVATLSVEGVPAEWVSTPRAFVTLAPGQRQEIPLTIQPGRSVQSQAGRYPVRIQVNSQATGGQAAEAACTLALGAYTEFSSELNPQRLTAGQPGRVTVENQGNVQNAFTLNWRSESDDLNFEPGPTQELNVPPGQAAAAEFRASPRQRPLFGGDKSYPFTAKVRSAGGQSQNLSGAVVGKGIFPSWLVAAVVIIALACLCLYVVGIVAGTGLLEPSPSEPAAPVEPTQPAEPTRAPEPTAPPEEPAEPPPAPTSPPSGAPAG